MLNNKFLYNEEIQPHYTHIDENPYVKGIDGLRASINYLRELRDELAGHTKGRITIVSKTDGSPSLFAGINSENGKFFISTKSIFNQNPKLNYTIDDIHKNHPHEGLSSKLEIALRYLPELGIRNIIQGDMLYVHSDLKEQTIYGKSYITFRPNTITYAVPADSELAKKISASKMGLVFHTSYTGIPGKSLSMSALIDVSTLNHTRNVWFRDASLIDASASNFTLGETQTITSYLAEIGDLFRRISSAFIGQVSTIDAYKTQIMAYNNNLVRLGNDSTANSTDFLNYIKEKYTTTASLQGPSKVAEKDYILRFFSKNKEQLDNMFKIQKLLIKAKLMVIRKLEERAALSGFYETSDGYQIAKAEGFVVSDQLGNNVLKLVDRLGFSKNNFEMSKNRK